MKIQPYIEKLNASEAFKKFQEEYKDAFLIAGFFILDYESGQDVHQIDYYIPSKKKVAAFTLGEEVDFKIMNMMSEKTPEKLDMKTEIDLDAIKGILEDGMKNRNITEELKKIIAVIQNIKGKKVWVLNCILSGMEILKAHIDDETKMILKMEKASVMDYMKKISPQMMQQKEPTKEDLDKQLEKLDKLKEILKKEEVELGKKKQES